MKEWGVREEENSISGGVIKGVVGNKDLIFLGPSEKHTSQKYLLLG